MWLIFPLLLMLLMLLPLHFSVRLSYSGQFQGGLLFRLGPIRYERPFLITAAPTGGHQLTLLPRSSGAAPRTPSAGQFRRGMTLLGTLLRTDRARRFLLRYTTLLELTLRGRIGLSSAARTAFIAGLAASLCALLPPGLRSKVHISIQPDFLTGRSTGELRCMVCLRLGILLITGGMVLTAWLMERREHIPTSKEVQSYGASHR